MKEKKLSKLAISSAILSLSSIFLGLSWIPGIICGHMARARMKSNPDLKGNVPALIGLGTGYLYAAVLIAIALYLSGYLERQVVVVDHGRTVWEGHFPHDANKDQKNRPDKVLTAVTIDGRIIGRVETRDANLRLVLKQDGHGKEITIWKYQDYSEVSRITSDEAKKSLFLYHSHSLIRDKDYITEVSLQDASVHKYLVKRGQWRL